MEFAQGLIDLPASQRAAAFTAHLSCWEDDSPATAGKDLAVVTWRVQVELCVLGGLVLFRDHLLAQPLSGYPPLHGRKFISKAN